MGLDVIKSEFIIYIPCHTIVEGYVIPGECGECQHIHLSAFCFHYLTSITSSFLVLCIGTEKMEEWFEVANGKFRFVSRVMVMIIILFPFSVLRTNEWILIKFHTRYTH